MRRLILAVPLALAPAAEAGLTMGLGKTAAKRAAAVVEKGREDAARREARTAGSAPTRVKWSYKGETVAYASPAIAGDGTVYFATSDHFVPYAAYWNQGLKPPSKPYGLYAYNADGTLRWKYSDGGDAPGRGSPVIGPDDTIYVVLERLGASQAATVEELHAVTPAGQRLWKVVISTFYVEIGSLAPAVAPDGTIYAAGQHLNALNPDGTVKWRHHPDPSQISHWFGSPAVGPDGAVYFVQWSTHAPWGQVLRALEPDGSVRWSSPDLGTYPITSSPAIASDGTVYLGLHDNNALSGGAEAALAAVSSSGTLKWAFPVPGEFDVRSQPSIAADGTVYFGTKGPRGYVYAVNPDGTLKWRHDTSADASCPGCGSDVYGTPAIGADGTVYAGNELSYLYAFNPDGTVLWKDNGLTGLNEGAFGWSSPAIADDGTLYVGTLYGRFLAVRTSSPGLSATAQWPRFHHGNRSQGFKP